jgi:RNA polymerase sigma-70 factor (ECF subfamily)
MMKEVTQPLPTFAAPGRTSDPDYALVEGWADRRDPAALAELIRIHRGYVFNLAHSVLGPAHEPDAEDVTQEAFIKVASRLHQFRRDSTFRTWLHRLTLNLALSRRRQPRWRKDRCDVDLLERLPAPVRRDDPFFAADAMERAQAVNECLGILPDSLRSIVRLRYWRELSLDEIATALCLSLGTVKSRLHRGRRLLSGEMEARGLHRGERRARLTSLPKSSIRPLHGRDRAPIRHTDS